MKADITRSTYDPLKRYSSVRLQQGRVQLDADWNEQADIQSYLLETTTADIIGPSGGPIGNAGFGLTVSGTQIRIGAGDYFVDGILLENDREISFTSQPDLPGAALPSANGTYLAYLHVFRRGITALEDPSIREVALGGPDTATRAKTIWQVQFLPVAGPGINCLSAIPEWTALVAPSAIRMGAQAEPTDVGDTPCIVPASAGYRALENRLYRVEIHDSGPNPTFKWSRENGSVETLWLAKSGNVLTVSSAGKDSTTGYKNGDWIELFDDRCELLQVPGTLVRLTKVQGTQFTIDPATATGSLTFADFSRNPRVRRWDSEGAIAVPSNSNPIDLEDGVQVIFDRSIARTGDYWTIPARVVTGDVEWPKDSGGDPVELLPEGIVHHFARLGVAVKSAGGWTITDCRNLFPTLTDQIELQYVSGDGQEAMPDLSVNTPAPLDEPLIVGVSNGEYPVAGRTVVFTAEPGVNGLLNGAAAATASVLTDAAGLATCTWALDPTRHSQQVTARLLDAGGTAVSLPVIFTGQLSTADEVAYAPKADCPALSQAKTVQEAIDLLCQVHDSGGCCDVSVGIGGDYPTVEAAIQDLVLKQGRKRVSLCLMAQEADHEAVDGLIVGATGLHLVIHGTGMPSRLVVKGDRGLVFRGLSSIAIHDLQIAGDGMDELILAVGCQDVTVRSCTISFGGLTQNSAAIRCLDGRRLRVEDCQINAIFTDNRDFQNFAKFDSRVKDLLLQDDVSFRSQVGTIATDLARSKADDRRRFLTRSSFDDTDAFAKTFSSPRVTEDAARKALDAARERITFLSPAIAVHAASADTVTTIEKIITNGNLLFYNGDIADMPSAVFDDIAKIASTGRFQMQASGAPAWIRGCIIRSYLVGSDIGSILTQQSDQSFDAFSEMKFEDNTFFGPNSVSVALTNVLDGNDWRSDGVLGMSIGSRNVFTGNVGLPERVYFSGAVVPVPAGMKTTNYLTIQG